MCSENEWQLVFPGSGCDMLETLRRFPCGILRVHRIAIKLRCFSFVFILYMVSRIVRGQTFESLLFHNVTHCQECYTEWKADASCPTPQFAGKEPSVRTSQLGWVEITQRHGEWSTGIDCMPQKNKYHSRKNRSWGGRKVKDIGTEMKGWMILMEWYTVVPVHIKIINLNSIVMILPELEQTWEGREEWDTPGSAQVLLSLLSALTLE